LRAAVALTLGGAAFALGNLALARELPKVEYGRFSLALAIVMIGILTGPIGAQVIVNRHPTDPGRRLLARTVSTSALVGLALTLGAGALYPLDPPLLAVMLSAIIAGGSNLVAVGHYQSRQQYTLSLIFTASTSLSLLTAGVASEIFHPATAFVPAAIFAACLWVSPVIGWAKAFRDRAGLRYPDPPFQWAEGLAAVATIGAGMVLGSIERLVIPRALGLADLATFSVLTTVAGAPFQILNQGVGFALLPNLRAAQHAAARRRVLDHELLVVLLTCALSAVIVWWVIPIVLHHVLIGRYALPGTLVLAAIAVGIMKPLGAVAVAAVNAVGSARDLAILGGITWTAVAVGFVGAWLGGRWGLTGLIYGVGMGWVLRAAASGWLAARSLQRAETPSATRPGLVGLLAGK
jgi:hypothetical protein